MAKRLPTSVGIELDKPRALRFSINAIADLEENTGSTLMDLMDPEKVGFRPLRALVWAGLKHEDPMLTITRAGDLIQVYLENGGTLPGIMEKVGRAVAASGLFGSADEKGGEGENPPTPAQA